MIPTAEAAPAKMATAGIVRGKVTDTNSNMMPAVILVEAADGSWFLSGIYGSGNNRMNGIVLIRFRPSGEKWTADVLSTMIPRAIGASRFVYSSSAGYGLMVAHNVNTSQQTGVANSAAAVADMYSATSLALNRLNLLRFHPDEGTLYDVWYMRRTGDTFDDMEMVPAQDFLTYVQAMAFGLSPDLPEGFSPEDEKRNPQPAILNVCMSPDGQHALLAVNTFISDLNYPVELYLLKPDTMELRHVEAPENTVGLNLAVSTPYSRAFLPGIEWNPDGTIVIHINEGAIGFFRLVTE